MSKLFAVIEDNKVINTIMANTLEDAQLVIPLNHTVIEYTDGWDYNNGIDGGVYFPVPEVTEPTE